MEIPGLLTLMALEGDHADGSKSIGWASSQAFAIGCNLIQLEFTSQGCTFLVQLELDEVDLKLQQRPQAAKIEALDFEGPRVIGY
ncbi:hypothetical protein VNO77_42598 [Canavalia gladiata]|uniref:Uncharacterized protein n=1 Tax=Canavalia gladiata TaxID=3824 RepID=A0AAN9PP68_CANGL